MSAPNLRNIDFSQQHTIIEGSKTSGHKELKGIDNKVFQWAAQKIGIAQQVTYNGIKHIVLNSHIEEFVKGNGGPQSFKAANLKPEVLQAFVTQAASRAADVRPDAVKIFQATSKISDTAENVHRFVVQLQNAGVKVPEEIIDRLNNQIKINPKKAIELDTKKFEIKKDIADAIAKAAENLTSKATERPQVGKLPRKESLERLFEDVSKVQDKSKARQKFEALPRPTAEDRARLTGKVEAKAMEKTASQRHTEALLGEHKAPASTQDVQEKARIMKAREEFAAKPTERPQVGKLASREGFDALYGEVSAVQAGKAKEARVARAEQRLVEVDKKIPARKEELMAKFTALTEALENNQEFKKSLSQKGGRIGTWAGKTELAEFRTALGKFDINKPNTRQIDRQFSRLEGYITKAWKQMDKEIPEDIAAKINDFRAQLASLNEARGERVKAKQDMTQARKKL